MGILTINAKCSDCCHVSFIDSNTNINIEHSGYVPEGIGIGGGNFICLQINTVTGEVLSSGLMTDIDKIYFMLFWFGCLGLCPNSIFY